MNKVLKIEHLALWKPIYNNFNYLFMTEQERYKLVKELKNRLYQNKISFEEFEKELNNLLG